MRHLACAAVVVLLPAFAVAQEPTIAVPPTVKVEGIPSVPQSVADGLARYAQYRQAQLIAWHPTKRQVLITTAFGEFPQLHLVDGPGKSRAQLTWLPRPGVSRLLFAAFDPADPNILVFQRDPAGGEAKSLYRYDMTTNEVSLVVDSKSRFGPVWSRQGKWIAYDSSERNGKDRDLYLVEPADPKTKRRLAEVEGPWSPQDWSPDGASLLALEIVSNFETYVWRVDVKTGEKKALTPRAGEKVAWFDIRYSADGRAVYAANDSADKPRIWRCDLASGKWTPVTSEADAIDTTTGVGATRSSSYELSADGSMMALLIDRGSTNELRVVDLGTMKARPLPALPPGVISQLRWRPGSREIGFSLASLKSPGDVYSIDTSLGTLSRWTTSEITFNADSLPPPEVVQFKSADGIPISAILYRPAAKFTGARPVMVQLHGGPYVRDRVRFQGRSNYFLNELGVALLFPNVRGSAGFGRAFEQLDNGRGRDGAIKDVGSLLDWIATRSDLDKDRVVLAGPSYGGWLALESGIVYNARIRGIIAGAAMTDLVTYLEQTDAARQDNRRKEFGDERDPEMRTYLTSISPVSRAADLKKATFILHPGKDARVPVGQAQELVAALKANHATVWYAEFSDANHDNFPTTNTNNDYMLATWIWFMKTFVVN
jgi:dipeptidyl aminopeptidase/acylaminoacyl peptidase